MTRTPLTADEWERRQAQLVEALAALLVADYRRREREELASRVEALPEQAETKRGLTDGPHPPTKNWSQP